MLPNITQLIFREEVNKEQDTFLWKQEIEEEVEETKEEFEREFRRKMLTYEEEMSKYQKQQQAKVRYLLHEREFRRKMLTYEEEMAKYQKQQQAKVQ